MNAITKCCDDCGCNPCRCSGISDCWNATIDFENLVTRTIQQLLSSSPTVQNAIAQSVVNMFIRDPHLQAMFAPIIEQQIANSIAIHNTLKQIIDQLLPQVITAPNVGLDPPILGYTNMQDLLEALQIVIVGGGIIVTGDVSAIIIGNLQSATATLSGDLSGSATDTQGDADTIEFTGDVENTP